MTRSIICFITCLLLIYSYRGIVCEPLTDSEYSDLVESSSEPLYPSRRFKPYQTVTINDPAQNSSGIYFRISQRGVDYLAELAMLGLPEIFYRMVLPTISESGLTLKDAVFTKFARPYIGVKFVRGLGVDISIRLTEIRLSGDTDLSIFFASYRAQMLAIIKNLTINMRVAINRDLDEPFTNVTVIGCTVSPGSLQLQYFGKDASEFYAIGNLIQSEIDTAIRDKVCMLPPLVRDFLRQKIDLLMEPPNLDAIPPTDATGTDDSSDPTLGDHLCGRGLTSSDFNLTLPEDEDDDPDVEMANFNGNWVPDLSLRYPPTFSDKDLIFGIDGGIMVDGIPTSDTVERPKFANVTVIRDQMLGLIISEYVPNSFFDNIYARDLGKISVIYSLKHVPRALRSIAKLVCPECKVVLSANLTTSPHISIDRNGIVLLLEGDISVYFVKSSASDYNILTANGQIRVVIKPHFRYSRLYSDVLLAGVEFKVYKAGMTGMVAGAVKKLLTFLVPRAIWPKIQHRLRLAVNHKGLQIPRICTFELQRLHLDYVRHAAIISADFDVDLPRLIGSFKQFVDDTMSPTITRKEYEKALRYLK
ncbi:nose resistant to fluoxetine protein 5 [Ditylenchus destructor]|uniref:Nose resistant to fluoxetine protein 5 n=1 Tax=Ditylenchus destructor TaxID=166010 RepID=A0AAD4NAR6_9BILA|nr:nose resistant to fluoxetine protein 5 [Ditylenchus destructor]